MTVNKYFCPGWRPLMESYVNTLQKNFLPEQMEIFREIVEWLVPICFKFMKSKCKLFIKTSETHLFHSFTKLFSCMLANETQVSTLFLQCNLIFCITWGLGSTMTLEDRKLFDVFFRKVGIRRCLNKGTIVKKQKLLFQKYFCKKVF